jgi:small-conductance mechanosensitive channel
VSEIVMKEWFAWAVALVLGFPLLAVILGEISYRLERQGHALAPVARGLRDLVLPMATLFLFVTEVLGFGGETFPMRLVLTGLLVALLYVALSAFNVLLFEQAGGDTWRANVPKLFLDLVRLFLVFVGGALVLSIVWNRNLGGLLAALGVGSIVLGLALQDTLGSLMSGIALLFERPFTIGDWIKLGDREGEVVEINWRSVRLRTRERDLLVVPNSVLAKETITNTCEPTRLHAERIPVAFGFSAPPNRVREVLVDVALSIQNVLADPPPKVEVMEFADDRIRYEAKLYMTNLRAIPKIRSEFATRVWYAAGRAGLELPIPTRTVVNLSPSETEDGSRAANSLRSVASFAALAEGEREPLARTARLLHYAANETVLRQGEPSEALCIVARGRARLSVATKAGEEREVLVLAAGELFGEGALLVRERSRVTVTASEDLEVVALDTAALKSVLESNAGLASELGQLVEVRRRAVDHTKQALHAVATGAAGMAPGARGGAG